MKRTVFVAFTFVTFAYIMLGAVIFHFLEGGNERKQKENFEIQHKEFLESNTCLSPEVVREYIVKIMDAQTHGVSVLSIVNKVNSSISNSSSSNSSSSSNNNNSSSTFAYQSGGDDEMTNWDMASAFLFCLTVVSTVGYGNYAPKTESGQMFCIVFALLGIPLFATSLVGVGERLQIPLHRIKRCRPWCKLNAKKDAQLKTAVFLSTGIWVVIFIPAWVLSKLEDWSFIESLYFCIITLTTIGFGDYVPGSGSRDHFFYIHRIILALWIMLGLSWIALILSELATIMQDKFLAAAKKTSHKFGDLEDIVKKKAKDAREKIVQKASIQWRRRSSHEKARKDASVDKGVAEIVDDPYDVTKPPSPEDKSTESNREHTSSNSEQGTMEEDTGVVNSSSIGFIDEHDKNENGNIACVDIR